jgi:hypothetical protein
MVNEKLHEVIYGGRFGSKIGFEAEINRIRDRLEWHLAQLQPMQDVLDYKKEFEGAATRANDYAYSHNYISVILFGTANGGVEGLQYVYQSLAELFEQINFASGVYEQIAENLFVTGPTPNIIGDKEINEIERLGSILQKQFAKLGAFIDNTPTINEYDAMRINQGKTVHKKPIENEGSNVFKPVEDIEVPRKNEAKEEQPQIKTKSKRQREGAENG